MTKGVAELARTLSEISGIAQWRCRRMLSSLGDAIVLELAQGNEVMLSGLGRWKSFMFKAHRYNSTYLGKEGMTRRKRAASFSTSQSFRDKLNWDLEEMEGKGE